MEVIELEAKVYVLEPISCEDVSRELAYYIDSTLVKDEKWREFHNSSGYKLYCFNQLWPLEVDKWYKVGKLYNFKIRTVNKELADYLLTNLENNKTESLKGVITTKRIIHKKIIGKLYTITPLIIKTEKGYWKKEISFEDFEKKIFSNLIKKYNFYTNSKIDENFSLYTGIKLLNEKPIAISYKGIKLLGDKVELEISGDKMAQELAYFALGTGLGEFNSRSAGFCNFLWV